MKYEFTGKKKKYNRVTLYQIRAIESFTSADYSIKAGELGGYISSESCLSQGGNSWVDTDSIVIDSEIGNGNIYISHSFIDKSKFLVNEYLHIVKNEDIHCIINSNIINSDIGYNATISNSTIRNSLVISSVVLSSFITNMTIRDSKIYHINIKNKVMNERRNYPTISSSIVDNLSSGFIINHTIYFLTEKMRFKVIFDNMRVVLAHDMEISSDDDFSMFINVGSRNDTLYAYKYKDEIMVQVGCFCGNIDEFENRVNETHINTRYEREYKHIINYLKERMMKRYDLTIEIGITEKEYVDGYTPYNIVHFLELIYCRHILTNIYPQYIETPANFRITSHDDPNTIPNTTETTGKLLKRTLCINEKEREVLLKTIDRFSISSQLFNYLRSIEGILRISIDNEVILEGSSCGKYITIIDKEGDNIHEEKTESKCDISRSPETGV